jgi:hypothetical protein
MSQCLSNSGSVVDASPADSPPGEEPLPIADCQLPIVDRKRRKGETPKRRKRLTDGSRAGAKDDWEGKVRAHRCRQASVAKILNRTFGRFAKSNPELWERRAYLMLVGLMYERLAVNEQDISTDELTALSKALAEQRRAEAQLRGSSEKEAQAVGAGGELPEDFGEVVKQIYGTNFHAPS